MEQQIDDGPSHFIQVLKLAYKFSVVAVNSWTCHILIYTQSEKQYVIHQSTPLPIRLLENNV